MQGIRFRGNDDIWWIVSTVLLLIAAVGIITSSTIYAFDASARMSTAAIVFQEVANVGTFLAATAAWFSAAASRKKSRRSDVPRTNIDNHEFLMRYMNSVMNGAINPEKSKQIERMVRILREANGSAELTTIFNSDNKNTSETPEGPTARKGAPALEK